MTTTKTVVHGLAPPNTWNFPKKFRASLVWFRENPIIYKEMRSRMRGLRSFVGLTVYIALVSGVILFIYASLTSLGTTLQFDLLRTLGRAIFFSIYSLELLIVSMTIPNLTAGAISLEKEQQTYDLLRTTLLPAGDLVLGKLIAALSYILLFIFATVPLQALALIFGGLTLPEILISQLILILTAVAIGSVGLFFSTAIAKTRLATGATQFVSITLTTLFPIFLVFMAFLLADRINLSYQSDLTVALIYCAMWLVGITNPILTAVFTEVIFFNQQMLFLIEVPLNSGQNFYLPALWLGFTLFYPLLIWLFLHLAIRNVRKVER